ncbi:MAG TPA: GNAT family N-acetyltransferase [Acidimicrobiia bacterium]|nr:GNAT family N-acetyltransferase [Acidimicrobiia bacterium]
MTRVRPVTLDDAGAIAGIYSPIVQHTAISFELEPPSADVIGHRIGTVTSGYPWLVLDIDGEVGGYAYAGPFKDRAAYRWSVETAIYLDVEVRGLGLGKFLYTALIDELREAGFANVFAGVTKPNPGSEALHVSAGFRPIGVFPRAGFKLGEWHDVGWWHRPLHDNPSPTEPRALLGCSR